MEGVKNDPSTLATKTSPTAEKDTENKRQGTSIIPKAVCLRVLTGLNALEIQLTYLDSARVVESERFVVIKLHLAQTV